MMLAAHDDGFFRACIHAESAVNTTHHVDVEPSREFLDLRVRMLAGFNVNALRRANRCAHIASDAFQAAVVADRQNVSSAEAFGIWPRLLRIINRWDVAFKQTRE